MQKKQVTLVIVSLLVVVLSVSLAYFTAQIIGKGKDVSVTSANLQIVFTDSDGNIEGSNITPGWSNSKTFTIKNDTKTEYKYNIVIKDLLNTFVTEGYLQYKITSTNGGYNMTEFKDVPKSSAPKDTILAYSVSIPVGLTQSYTIEFKYVNDESVDQSEDMGKTLSGILFITEGTEQPTLLSQILNDNPTRDTRNTYNAVFTNNTTGTLFTATEKNVHNTIDTTVYYYAGNTTNNWVKFGKFQNDLIRYRGSGITALYGEYSTMDECTSVYSKCTEYKYANTGDDIYWRIIRTNSDGSVRLLYAGTSPDTTTGCIGKSAFNTSENSPKYVGYMYGENADTLVNAKTNTNNSTIKTYIDNWYASNMTSYTKYLSTTAVYCNDRTEKTSGTYNTGSTDFYYAPNARLYTNKTPSYDCTEASDAFSGSNTSAKLTYPIALMTVDEIMRAGGTSSNNLTSPYAWYYLNSSGESITGASSSWLLSPRGWYDSHANAFSVMGSPGPGALNYNDLSFILAVRPAISLKSCIKYGIGDGSATNPYTILETESGC
jgi:hypothetical protein